MNIWLLLGVAYLLLKKSTPLTPAQQAAAAAAAAQQKPKATPSSPKSGAGSGGGSSGGAAHTGSASSSLPAWMQSLTSYKDNQVDTISESGIDLGQIASVEVPTYTAPDQSSWIDQAIGAGLNSGNAADTAGFGIDYLGSDTSSIGLSGDGGGGGSFDSRDEYAGDDGGGWDW